MLSKSLIQFSVDGLSCVPSLLFTWGQTSLVAQKVSVYNVGDLGSIPGSGNSLEKEMQPTPVLLPRKSHGRRSLVSMGSQRVRHD